MKTVLAKLVAQECDCGYTTYVFRKLEETDEEKKYIMCIRYPNWNHRELKLGDIGFLYYTEVEAGIDTWYDGTKMVPYKYNAIQFLKFIDLPETSDKEYVM